MKRSAFPGYEIILTSFLLIAGTFSIGAEPVTQILQRASTQLGTPYRIGGAAPGGFDCSGFVSWLYRPTLPDIPRVSRDMSRIGRPVAPGEWQAGDLLFYATGSDPGRINHVAVWYDEGYIIHSISDGPETGVVITPALARYWDRRYVGSRRILQDYTGSKLPELPPEPVVGIQPDTASGLPEGEPSRTEPVQPARTESPAPTPQEIIESPWNDFEGVLRGDFEAWKAADEDAFEAYKRENG